MPQVGLEPTIPVFERAKTVHALDSAATVIGLQFTAAHNKCSQSAVSSPVVIRWRLPTVDVRLPLGSRTASGPLLTARLNRSSPLTVHQSTHFIPLHCPALTTLKSKSKSRLAVYRQSVRLGVKPFETHDQRLF
jgi:hypothetical protein